MNGASFCHFIVLLLVHLATRFFHSIVKCWLQMKTNSWLSFISVSITHWAQLFPKHGSGSVRSFSDRRVPCIRWWCWHVAGASSIARWTRCSWSSPAGCPAEDWAGLIDRQEERENGFEGLQSYVVREYFTCVFCINIFATRRQVC